MSDKSHSLLGASGMSRWVACPGSVRLQRAFPAEYSRTSEFAAVGTLAHSVAERALRGQRDAWEFHGETAEVDGIECVVDDAMIDHVQTFIDAVRGLTGPHDLAFYEVPVDLSDYHPSLWGTADVVILHRTSAKARFRSMSVVDLKYGEGVAVSAVGNNQLRYYAAAAWHTLGAREDIDLDHCESARMMIVQPRIEQDGAAVVSEDVMLTDDLGEWIEAVLLPAVKATEAEDAPLVAGDHCRFCPSAINCPVLRGAYDDFDTAEAAGEDISALGEPALAQRVERIDAVKRYIRALESETFNRLSAGKDVPGFKLVEKRTNRVWKDGAEEAVKAAFGDEAMAPAAVKPLTQIEKLEGGREFVQEWAYKPQGGLTFAPVSDNRNEVAPRTAATVFADV